MLLQSFLVYTISALMMFYLCRISMKRTEIGETHSSGLTIGEWLAILVFVLLAGMRYQVGVDYLSYLDIYNEIKLNGWTQRDALEPGFMWITKIFASFNLHYFYYFACFAFLQIFFVFYAFRNEKKLLPYIGLFIVLGPYFLDWMNGIRQCIAECVFVFSIAFIVKRKILLYCLIIYLCTFMHTSAIMLLPFYFLPRISYSVSKYWFLGILMACVIIGNNPTFIYKITQYTDLFLTGKENTDRYFSSLNVVLQNTREMAWGPSRICLLVINLLIIWNYQKMKEYFTKAPNLNLYFILSFIGACLFNLLASTHHLFLRPVGYFTIFCLPMSAYLILYYREKGNNVLYLLCLLIICFYTLFSCFKASLMPPIFDATNYKFFFV